MISLIPRQNKSLNNINLKTQHLAPRPFRLSRRDAAYSIHFITARNPYLSKNAKKIVSCLFFNPKNLFINFLIKKCTAHPLKKIHE